MSTRFTWVVPVMIGIIATASWMMLQRPPSDDQRSRKQSLWMSDDQSPELAGAAGQSVDALLREMIAAYKNLNSYSDTTRMELRTFSDGQWKEQTAKLQIAYKRPDRLLVTLDQAADGVRIDILADGDEITATVLDPLTDNFDHQIAMRPMPRQLEVASLYAITEYIDLARPNELFSLLMALPASLQLTPLSPLLESSPLQPLITDARRRSRIADAMIDGHRCHGIELEGEFGLFRLWIDAERHWLRKIEYPTVGPDERPTATLGVTFENIGAPSDNVAKLFRRSDRAQKRMVQRFVLPPDTRPPPALNRLITAQRLVDLQGREIDTREWRGKITIAGWFQCRLPHRAMLAELQATAERLAGQEDVRVMAICTEPRGTSDDMIESTLAEWQVTVPVLRDVDGALSRRLQLSDTPTLIVVDPQGRVQVEEPGASEGLDEQLPLVVEKVRSGAQLANDYAEFLRQQRQAYEEALLAASVEPPTQLIRPATIAPAKRPASVRLERLWTIDSIRSPGNLAAWVTPDDRLAGVVLSGPEVHEIDGDGTIVARRPIDEADGISWTKIDTMPSRDGRMFLVWSNLGRQVALFDSRWNILVRYPANDQTHGGIVDACLADLNGDGDVKCHVAFADAEGLHQITPAGEMVWRNRLIAPLLSVTSSPDQTGKSFLLVTNQSGEIIPVSDSGELRKILRIGSRAIHELRVAQRGNVESPFCGLSLLPDGQQLAIGANGAFDESFELRLPDGPFSSPIQHVQSCRRQEDWMWIIGGADGSIFFLSQDGRFRDRWQTGRDLTGMSAVTTRQGTILLLASRDLIDAYEVKFPSP